MKRLALLLLALMLALAPLAAMAQAEASESAPGDAAPAVEPTEIHAIGSASVPLPADIAVLTLFVSATGDTVTDAQAAAEAVMTALTEAIAQKGVEPDDVQTVSYGVETIYNYQYSKLGEQETPSGYSVSSDIRVRVRDAERVGEVIDAAVLSGAKSSYELTFESSRQQEAYLEALSLATADAMQKAALLAKASGLTLGALKSVTETQPAAVADIGANTRTDLAAVAAVEVCYRVE